MGVTLGALCATLLRQILRYLVPFKNLIIILLVFAFKLVLTDHAFKCPCHLDSDDDGDSVPPERIAYGSLFISVPAAVLWMLGVLLVDSTWRCLTGCKKQPCCGYCGRTTACIFQTLANTALAPISWLVFVFLDGTYLECTMAGVPSHCVTEEPPENINGTAVERPSIDLKDPEDIQWLSQLIGVSLAGAAFLVYFVVVLVIACCSNTTWHHRRYGDQLQQLEEETMATALREHHEENLKAKWRMLFSGGSQSDWVNISAPESVNPAWQTKQKTVLFTPFQECTHDVHIPSPAIDPLIKRQSSMRNSTTKPTTPRPQVQLPDENSKESKVDTEDGKPRRLPPVRYPPQTAHGSRAPPPAAPVLPPYNPSYGMQVQYSPMYSDPRLYSIQNTLYSPKGVEHHPLVPYGKDTPTFSQPKNKTKKKKKVKRSQVMDSGGEYEA